MKLFVILLAIVLLILLGMFGYTYQVLSQSINTHISAVDDLPEEFDLTAQEIEIGSPDRRIKSWHFPVESPKAGVVLIHGYGRPKGGKGNMLTHAKYLHDNGYETLLIDLYSFGDNNGHKITFGRDEWQDAQAGFQFLKNQPTLKDKKIGFFGISMGASTAIITAGKEKIGDFLFLSVPFASLENLFRQQAIKSGFSPALFMPFIKASLNLLIPNYQNPIDYAQEINVPTLIFQAQLDESSLPEDAEKLAKEIHNSTLVVFNTEHDIHSSAQKKFEDEVLRFLEKNL